MSEREVIEAKCAAQQERALRDPALLQKEALLRAVNQEGLDVDFQKVIEQNTTPNPETAAPLPQVFASPGEKGTSIPGGLGEIPPGMPKEVFIEDLRNFMLASLRNMQGQEPGKYSNNEVAGMYYQVIAGRNFNAWSQMLLELEVAIEPLASQG